MVKIEGKGTVPFRYKNGEERLLTEVEEESWLWHARLGHVNFDAMKLMSGKRIMRHLTTPYSPQQNGVVERRNRTVVAMTRSFLKENEMPTMFLREAVRHSTNILNRVPTKVLKGETPYEAWKGMKPDLSFIKIFGCLAHVKVPKERVQKLDGRSTKMVYLGKEPGSKANRLFDPLTGRLSVSIDVVFEENKGWNWSKELIECENNNGSFVLIETPKQAQQEVSEFEMHMLIDSYGMGSNQNSSGTSSGNNSGNSSSSSSSGSSFDGSSEPRKFKLLNDVYNDT
ncbi:hypothetical protein AgCh_016605 [Apium graveolens]